MRKILVFALCLGALVAKSQSGSIDSLKALLDRPKNESERIKVLLELCWELRFVNADTARAYGLQALSLSRDLNYKDYEVEALHNVGITHEAQGNYKEALDFELSALTLRKKIGDDSKTANTLNNIGIIYDEQGNFPKAIEYYLSARKIYEYLNDDEKIAMVIINMAIVFKSQKEYQRVISNYQEALSIYTRLNKKFGIAVCHANLGSVYYYLPNYDSALHYSLLASNEFEAQNVQQFLPTTLCNAGMAYDKLGNKELAKSYLLRAKKLNETYDNKKELSFVMIYLANMYREDGKFELAEKLASDALTLAQRINARKEVMDARLALADVKAGQQNFEGAYAELKKSMVVKDTLYQQEKAKQMAELQTQYETVKKENEILVLKQENEIKDSRLNQSLLAIFLLLAMLGAIIAFGYLWKNRLKLKQQAELQTTRAALRESQLKAVIGSQEEERKRFAADLHDGFGQMISALRLSLSREVVEKPTVDHALGVLNDMNLEIRNIAFNLMPQVLMKSGIQEALKEFASRINRSGGVSVAVQTYNLDKEMSVDHGIALYRICQEWVNNVIKYSGGDQISIQLVQHPEELILTIEDNGNGFDVEDLTASHGNGWKNINSRLHMIKGTIEIDTKKGRRGTTMVVAVPLLVAQVE
ncbi:MAG: tetratricopeptide repeat protein [Cyclobacteriaceae bacterium]|nr:tetratricopeptide repeat protein [Cyclobacteriaceae bacterium]